MGEIVVPVVKETFEPDEEAPAPEAEVAAPADTRDGGPQDDLRVVIDKLLEKRFADVSSAEIRLLEDTLESTAHSTVQNAQTERLTGLITELLADHARYSDTEIAHLVDELPVQRHALVSEEFFRSKERTKVTSLAGVETDLVVSTYELEGIVEIEGDVPVDTLLIVRRGGVTINGYVFGNVIAEGPVSISKNVHGGWVITSVGGIEVENILTGSSIVAQEGTITCESIETPDVVFALKGVTVKQNLRGGLIFGATVSVGGTISAAEVHAVGTIKARGFDTTSGSETVLCLRREITCVDYGRPFGESYGPLKRSLTTDRYRRELLTNFVRYTEADVFDCYRSMLYFLLGGVDNRRTLCILRGRQCSIIYIEELLDATKTFAEFLQGHLQSPREKAIEEVTPVADECLNLLEGIRAAVKLIPQEFAVGIRKDLQSMNQQLSTIVRKAKKLEDPQGIAYCSDMLEQYMETWHKELLTARHESQLIVHKLGLSAEISKRIEKEADRLPLMFDTVIKNGGERLPRDQRTRIATGFMRLTQSAVSQHQTNIANWSKELEKLEERMGTTLSNLHEESHIISGDGEAHGPCQAMAEHFDKDVIISALSGHSSDIAADGKKIVRVSEPINEPTIFRLLGTIIRRESARGK